MEVKGGVSRVVILRKNYSNSMISILKVYVSRYSNFELVGNSLVQ